jgi:hypothetical protein
MFKCEVDQIRVAQNSIQDKSASRKLPFDARTWKTHKYWTDVDTPNLYTIFINSTFLFSPSLAGHYAFFSDPNSLPTLNSIHLNKQHQDR